MAAAFSTSSSAVNGRGARSSHQSQDRDPADETRVTFKWKDYRKRTRIGQDVDANDPGCVKTLEAIVGAQQKNRCHSLDESFMRGWPSLCTNLVPERPIEWFSHSQDPERNSDHANKCVSKVL